MADSLQEEIRERARERDEEGGFANKSLEDLHHAGRGTPLRKRRKKGRTPVLKSAAADASTAAGTVRAGDGRWFQEALIGSAPSSPLSKSAIAEASPVVGMLDDMQRVLEVFRSEEGRDPTTDDKEFWRAYTKIIANRIGGSE